jgi:ABC-type transporter Mla maintaining outer membrane lipid asymmetry ATPase subunit MlaF
MTVAASLSRFTSSCLHVSRAMPDPTAILEFTGVTVEADAMYDSGVWNVSLRLLPSELALVRMERGSLRLPLADAAQGLADVAEGSVSFLGRDWREVRPAEADRRRGQIGRVFDESTGSGWVSNLDVDENVLLAQRHHTGRPQKEIADEAARLARMFGLPGLPRGRPAHTRPHDLARAGLVRAVLGHPDLLVLERPTQGYPELLPSTVNVVRAARLRGAAVLWTTAEAAVWTNPGLRPTYKCAMSGAQMLVTREGEPATES